MTDEIEEGEIVEDDEITFHLSDISDAENDFQQQNCINSEVTDLELRDEANRTRKNLASTLKEMYEMDDYELLIARHHLIQQQLENIGSTPRKEKKLTHQMKRVRKSKKRVTGNRITSDAPVKKSTIIQGIEDISPDDSVSAPISNAEKSVLQEINSDPIVSQVNNQHDKKAKDDDGDDDELELLNMRKQLLAQTGKNKQMKIKTKESSEVYSNLENELSSEKHDDTSDTNQMKPKIDTIDLTEVLPAKQSLDECSKNENTLNSHKKANDPFGVKAEVLKLRSIVRKRKSSQTDNSNKMLFKRSMGEKLTKNQRKKLNKRFSLSSSSPSLNTRSKKSLQDRDFNELFKQIDAPKRKRRGGRRMKYLAYRAQLKQENEFFQRQKDELEALDNYTNVPMDIDDDDDTTATGGIAPLPLIETPEVKPPLPPSGFKPVEDRLSLQMTSQNVAWMPGYVETLEIPSQRKDTSTPPIPSSQPVKVKELEEVKETVEHKDTKAEEENELWDLRAQALKSLACKRAAKAKEKVMSTEKELKSEKVAEKPKIKLLDKIESSLSISPVPTPVSSTPTADRSKDILNTFVPSPKHPPVIIQLTKEDFEPDEDMIACRQISVKTFPTASPQGKILNVKCPRPPGDEHLLKELQSTSQKSNTRLKKISSYILKDQLAYKKLQSDISSKKSLFDKQNALVKDLEKQLDAAVKQRLAYKKAHIKAFNEIKAVKENLKKKVTIRNKVSEELLRARSISSIGKKKLNGTSYPEKMRQQMIFLSKSLQQSYKEMITIDLLHQEKESKQAAQSKAPSESNDNRGVLQETAAVIKNMDKKSLTQLEQELREKLSAYQKKKNIGIKKIDEKIERDKENPERVTLNCLPDIKTRKELEKLQKYLSTTTSKETTEFSHHQDIHTLLQSSKNLNKIKTLTIIKNNNQKSKDSVNIDTNEALTFSMKYISPLKRFKSYRLSPHFRMQSKFSLQSPSFSNTIDPLKTLCKYDISGSCNDSLCRFWHFKECCNLNCNQIISDLVSYYPQLFNATENMSVETKVKLLQTYVTQFNENFSSKMCDDDKVLLLWNKLKESRRNHQEPIYACIQFQKRSWYLRHRISHLTRDETNSNVLYSKLHVPLYFLKKKTADKTLPDEDNCQEIRYFFETYNSIEILEQAVQDSPNDCKLWLSLAHQHLKNDNKNIEVASENYDEVSHLENALSVLSRALEQNQDNEELWVCYLKLFAKTSSLEELRELCFQSVMYAQTYKVWWTCLQLETSHTGKQEICTEMIKFVLESEADESKASHYLLEIVLYLCYLLCDRRCHSIAIQFMSACLGGDTYSDDVEKLNSIDITASLTIQDKSFLWISLICLQVFNDIPKQFFEFENSSPGRIVSKDRFILNWKRSSNSLTTDQIRNLFQAALKNLEPTTSMSAMKSSMVVYENLFAFEIENGNTKDVVEQLQKIGKIMPTFIEGSVLLLKMYISHSRMETVVTVAEDCVHRCDYDIEVVYHYAEWLLGQGMPNLALEKLTKCIHMYFGIEDEEENLPDVLHLYQKVLGLPVPINIKLSVYLPSVKSSSQHLMYYYWMAYFLLLKVKNHTAEDIENAFESAVHQYTSCNVNKKLWMAYIEYRIRELSKLETISSEEYHSFIDMMTRALMSVPARSIVSTDQNVHWIDYSFHNKIIASCMKLIPFEERSKVYRKTIINMPDNSPLAERICEHEMKIENYDQARVICGFMLTEFPKCLPLWKKAIQLEIKCNCLKEARWLYEESTKHLPFNASLWSDFANFEISTAASDEGNKLNDRLTLIISKADKNGIDLRSTLLKLQTIK